MPLDTALTVDSSPDGLARLPLEVPLVLDLDGTLIKSDLLWEGLVTTLRSDPGRALSALAGIWSGRARLKRGLAEGTAGHTLEFPFNDAVLALALQEHRRGRAVYVATAADQAMASRVLEGHGFVKAVFGSDGVRNLKGRHKADFLQKEFPQGFIYVGDSWTDLSIWRRARYGIAVGRFRWLFVRAAPQLRIPSGASKPLSLFTALRPHHWVKNLLVFVPLAVSGLHSSAAAWLASSLAFLALSAVASATYMLNDVLDVQEDRRHWSKRNRPIAKGDLPIPVAVVALVLLLVAGFALVSLTTSTAAVALGAYFALTVTYSLMLKRVVFGDVFALASLFTLRIFLGVAAVGAAVSPWILVFSMFLFLSLSLSKRYTELHRARQDTVHTATLLRARGYRPEDLGLVLSAGIAAGFGAIIVMVLYLAEIPSAAAKHYRSPQLLWPIPLLLAIWLMRLWTVANRGEMKDDPVVFALKDRLSIFVAILMLSLLLAALLAR